MIRCFIVKDEQMKETKGFRLRDIIIIIIITSIITSLTTGVIVYNQNRLTKNITFQDLSKDTDLKEFLKVYASLIEDYYENVDKKAMLESAIEAMFNYLGEDYSTYMSQEETNSLADQLKGEYKGLGIQLNRSTKAIEGFVEGGDAKESGLMIGDIIIKVDDKEINSTDEINEIVEKTKEGTKLNITVNRNEEILSFDVENKKILIPAIAYVLMENNIGYLKMEQFSNTLSEQVEFALKDMEQNGMKSLIIDLRDNTGGYLKEAKDIASMFLEKGKTIYSLEEKNGNTVFKDETNEKRDYKIVILMNESSASASEVLIAALKESYGAITVGTRSYGKGKVQQTRNLEDGSMVKYTSAKWLTPNGECIDGFGIKPDYEIEKEMNSSFDEQLEKAIELAEGE